MTPFDAKDLYLFKTIESLGGAADQDELVFIVANADEGMDDYQSAIWLLQPASFKSPRRLTSLAHDAKSPSLSPDARCVAFLSTRDPKEGVQVHTLPLDGGEASALTKLESVPGKIHMWSPDGASLLVSARAAWAEDEFDDSKAGKNRPLVAGFLPYKSDGGTYKVGHRTQLLGINASSGTARTLMSGDFDVQDAQWSPSGNRLAFVRNRTGSERHLTDLWLADASGDHAERVTHAIASISGVRWSPDGSRIAFSGSRREGDSLTNLWIYDLRTREASLPAGDGLQLEGQWIVWHPRGGQIATVVARHGLLEIGVIDLSTGEVQRRHAGLRHVHALCSSQDRLVFVSASVRRLDEIESVRWNGDGHRRHSAFNLGWFSERARPRAIKRRFTVPDGDGGEEKIDAWLLLPAHREGPFPLLVDMHGGPQSFALLDFANHAYWYDLCAKGWAIVAPNAVGSSSYGTDFARRLIGRWGELDLPQYLAIVDALQKEGIADLRVACTGKSYGGFLSAWALGNSSRFTSAVVSAPVANIESHAGTSDSGFYVTPYAMGGELTELQQRYHALSPIHYCQHSTTPALILQGKADERCPIGQSEELFAKLVRHGRAPCKLVVYPDGSHDMAASGKPSHRVDYHRRIVAWVQQWTADDTDAQNEPGERAPQTQDSAA